MNKSDLKKDDILILKNNHTVVMDVTKFRIIHEKYDDKLNCINDDNYTIVKIFRPKYELIYDKSKTNLDGHTQTKIKK